ncbi:MAG: anaerobic sulfatase maturase [Chloroflexota bacterium]
MLVKPASGDCNLHCTYCFYHDRETDPYKQERRRRMPPNVLDALIRQGMALDRRQATFGWQGGEPTLAGLDFFQRAVELQKRYGAPGQAASNGLQTNALLLTPEWARFLRHYNFLLGVSLDGPAEYHDPYRQYVSGAPTHARVMDALRMLGAYGVEFNILSVVNRLTSDHGAEIYDWLVAQGFGFLQFIPCVETDAATGQVTDFSVTPEQYGEFLCQVFDRWYNSGQPQASVRDFEAILAVYVGQEAPLCCYQEQCGSYLVVEYNGDLYPCDFLVREDTYIGNLMDMSLEQAFASEALGRFKVQKADPRPECLACAWLPYCRQGCTRFVGVAGVPRHYLCRAYQRFFAHSHEAFTALSERVLRHMGADPQRAQTPTPRPVGRNDPCPCGSGKKFKNCCFRRGAA